MQISITNIDWDTDGEDVDLPTEMVIDTVENGIADPDLDLANWLSDKYGWCVTGVSYEPVSAPGPKAP